MPSDLKKDTHNLASHPPTNARVLKKQVILLGFIQGGVTPERHFYATWHDFNENIRSRFKQYKNPISYRESVLRGIL